MINRSSLDNSVSQLFNSLELEAEVSFSLTRGVPAHQIGRDLNGFIIRERPTAIAEYTLEYKGLKPEDLTNLINITDTLRTTVFTFAFNDFSDNFVLDWRCGGVQQKGIVVPLTNQPDSYICCKQYIAGKHYTLRPIRFFDVASDIEINGQTVTNQIDRTTGVVTSASDLTGATFQTDLCYTSVQIDSPLQYSPYYDRGSNIETINRVDDTNPDQQFRASLKLKERLINEVIDWDIFDEITSNPLTALELDGQINGMGFSDSHRSPRWEHNDIVFQQLSTNQRRNRTIQIPDRIYPHRELLYWQTLFRATGGTGLTLDNP